MQTLCVSLAFLLNALMPVPPQTDAKAATASIAQLAWMGGNWQGQKGPVALEENWMGPGGGLMLAVSRTAQGGKLRTFEFLRIVERNGTLVYIAMPSAKGETEFVATSVTSNSVTFENRAHDFPKVIRYTLTSPKSLDAVISDGAQVIQTFKFTK